jgi:hypothetical protein
MRNLSSAAQPKFKEIPREGIDELPDEEEPKLELAEPEKDVEQKTERQEVNTVEDFINSLEWEYSECANEQVKNKIALQIIKIEVALRASGLDAGKVYVSRMPDGILGLFDPNANRIEFSEDLLSDFNSDEQLLKTVFVHEEVHKDKKFADEGLTQLYVRRIISATSGIYEEEQRVAEEAFREIGIEKALELYDPEHPERLLGECLRIGLKIKYRGQTKILKGVESDEKKLGFVAREEKKRISKKFQKGAEELF